MRLSPKDVRFLIEALDHYQKYQDQRLQQEGLSEEDASDLSNDRQYLEALKRALAKYHEAIVRQCQDAETDASVPR